MPRSKIDKKSATLGNSISYHSLHETNLVSRGPRGEVKKVKSSKLNLQNNEGATQKMVKNGSIWLKQGCCTELQKYF